MPKLAVHDNLNRDAGAITSTDCALLVQVELFSGWPTGRIVTRDLYLREAAIHEQFRSCDVAAVVGREKHDGLSDFIGRAEPA